MRIILFLFLSQLFFCSVYAQSTRSLRLNMVLSPGPIEGSSPELAPPVAAFQIQPTSQWRHGFELANLQLQGWQSFGPTDNAINRRSPYRDLHFAIRYQLDYLFGNAESKWRFYTGMSAQVGLERLTNRPITPITFASQSTEFYLEIAAVPGLQRRLSEKLHMHVSLPIRLIHTNIGIERTANPTTPQNEQGRVFSTRDILPYPLGALRLGLSYAI